MKKCKDSKCIYYKVCSRNFSNCRVKRIQIKHETDKIITSFFGY